MVAERISESELVLPSLFVMEMHGGSITTSDLIKELSALLRPTGKDTEISANRKDTRFSQKVRNLRSHKTLDERHLFSTYKRVSNNGVHTITETGRGYLIQNMEAVRYLLNNNFPYDDLGTAFKEVAVATKQKKTVLTFDENMLINEGAQSTKNTKTYERSKILRDYAIQYYSKGEHISCSACSFDFYSFYGEIGKGFIEIHHKKPVFQYSEVEGEMFLKHAVDNVAPVCSNCHRMIHRKWSEPISLDYLIKAIKSQANAGRRK